MTKTTRKTIRAHLKNMAYYHQRVAELELTKPSQMAEI